MKPKTESLQKNLELHNVFKLIFGIYKGKDTNKF